MADNETNGAESAGNIGAEGAAENAEKKGEVVQIPEIVVDEMTWLPAAINSNYDEVKAALVKSLENTKGLVATEDNCASIKKVRADINKKEKMLKTAKTTVKNRLLTPFKTFEEKVDELIKICEDSHDPLDQQIKEIEANLREKKRADVQKIIDEEVQAAFADDEKYLKSEFWKNLISNNEKWLNVNTSMKSIKRDVIAIVEECKANIATLRETYEADAPEITVKAEMLFAKSFDYADTCRQVNAYKKEQKEIAERAEKERMAREAAAREKAEREARERAAREARQREEAAKAATPPPAAAPAPAATPAPAPAAATSSDDAMKGAMANLAAKRSGAVSSVPPVAAQPAQTVQAATPAKPAEKVYNLTLQFHATMNQMLALKAFMAEQKITYTKIGEITEVAPEGK